MKKVSLLLALLSTSLFFAQGGQSHGANLSGGSVDASFRQTFDAVNYNGFHLAKKSGPKVLGTPFAFKNAPMVLNTTEGKSFKVPNGNYNAKSNYIVSNFAKDSSFVFNAGSIESVKIDKYVAKQFITERGKKRFFFDATPRASVKLLKQFVATIKQGQVNVMTKLKTSQDKYILRDYLLISKDGKTAEKIRFKKKTILKLFNDKKDLIEKFVVDNNLSYKDETDLVKIFNYYSIN